MNIKDAKKTLEELEKKDFLLREIQKKIMKIEETLAQYKNEVIAENSLNTISN